MLLVCFFFSVFTKVGFFDLFSFFLKKKKQFSPVSLKKCFCFLVYTFSKFSCFFNFQKLTPLKRSFPFFSLSRYLSNGHFQKKKTMFLPVLLSLFYVPQNILKNLTLFAHLINFCVRSLFCFGKNSFLMLPRNIIRVYAD